MIHRGAAPEVGGLTESLKVAVPIVGAPKWRTLKRSLLVTLGIALLAVAFAQDKVSVVVIVPTAGGDALQAVAADDARMGAVSAQEELALNASIFNVDFGVTVVEADGADGVTAAATKAIEEDGAIAIAGGFTDAEAEALAVVADQDQVPFFNIGSASDALRNADCNANMFHVVPSAAMYLDAMAGWFVRSGLRNWVFVLPEGDAGEALFQRAKWGLEQNHFAARIAGKVVVPAGEAGADTTIQAVKKANADVVVLLIETNDQLAFLKSYDAAGLTAQVTEFPYPATQTRAFAAAALAAAPNAGGGFRPVAWEASLDAYGARELNARFLKRWQKPMEPAAWAAYMAVKMVFDASTVGGARTGPDVATYLMAPSTVFDVWKGIAVTFRPWDQQLRQPLYLVQVVPDDGTPYGGEVLVGQLPAIYMPGTEAEDRLDQIGDLQNHTTCKLGG